MTLPVKELEYESLVRRLHQQAVRDRIPLSGTVALSYRCNLRCPHCYLSAKTEKAPLPTARWLELLDQIVDAGCLYLLLTGGEPLLHPDFQRIYLHAKQRGLLVSVFTNGTTLTEEVVDLWQRWPPHVVEISIYGFSRNTTGEVTGFPEARDRCLASARRLAAAGIPLRLKTMALQANAHELSQLQQFADELGVSFRFDAMVNAALDGSQAPCATRLAPERIVGFDQQGPRHAAWEAYLASRPEASARLGLFDCGGGQTSFFVNPEGHLSLCAFDTPVHDLRKSDFASGWRGPMRRRRAQELPQEHACRGCRDQVFCGVCPPVARMETGDEMGTPQGLCKLGKLRARAFAEQLDVGPEELA